VLEYSKFKRILKLEILRLPLVDLDNPFIRQDQACLTYKTLFKVMGVLDVEVYRNLLFAGLDLARHQLDFAAICCRFSNIYFRMH